MTLITCHLPGWEATQGKEAHAWQRGQQKQRQESAKTSLGIQGQGLQVGRVMGGLGLGDDLTLEQSHVWNFLSQHLTPHYNRWAA